MADPFAKYQKEALAQSGAQGVDDPFAKYAAPDATPKDDRSALARFFGRVLPSTTPSDYIEGPLYSLTHPKDAASLLWDALKKDPVGAVPVVGPARNMVNDFGEGNYAGAAGDAANIALSLLPLKKFAPGAISAAVEGGARTGASVARGVGAAADLAAEGLNHPLIGAKVPYGIAKLTSKLANKTAPALDAVAENSLESRTPQAVNRFKTIRPSREIPYRYNGELPETTTPEPPPSPFDRYSPNTSGTPDAGVPQGPMPTSSLAGLDRYSPNTSGIPDNGVGPRPMTPFELWQQENPMGAGRNTYTAQPGETPPAGSLADLAKLSRYPTPEAAMTDLADSYGHGLQAEPSFIDSLPEVPEFEYTGSADYLPGESTGPGVSSSAEQNLLNSSSFRKLTSLNRR